MSHYLVFMKLENLLQNLVIIVVKPVTELQITVVHLVIVITIENNLVICVIQNQDFMTQEFLKLNLVTTLAPLVQDP